ncbi:TadE/TadG family type IV pilus assembly protein [Sphingorhabdus sp.]|uniref:TadE/TadG family type IV pilus assembly protein n=1 Tax=Sphingorhabdus sp. TaxID=1902408 RepID=UPI003983005D
MMYFSPNLIRRQDGASVMEFGLIAPVAMVMMLGTMDIGHSYYVRATLDGAMQAAARSSSLEGASTITAQELVDLRVKEAVLTLAPNATITSIRRYYKTFSEASAARAETVIEAPVGANMKCDPGESFMDANRNGIWDPDGGSNGQGGAKDIVIIKFKVTYPRVFPLAKMIGVPANVEMESGSILANQPYGEQTTYGSPVQTNCPSA